MEEPHVMLFDLYAGGHHGHHVQQLVQYWKRQSLPGTLSIVVPESFLEAHAALASLVQEGRQSGVQLIPIREAVHVDEDRSFQLLRNDLEHRRLLRKYVRSVRPDHVLLMYFDHVQVSLALDLRFDFPVHFSGIYFRPTFHYRHFPGTRIDWRHRLRDARKLTLLYAALRNPHFATLLCFDPFAAPHAQKLNASTQAVALPDGIERTPAHETPPEVRERLGVAPDRRMLLLFGVLSRRKGVLAALEAMLDLPEEERAAVSLVLAGSVEESIHDEVCERVEKLRASTALQVVLRDEFVPEEEIQDLFRAADLALLPYVGHVGSSGLLVRAAAEQTPVLGARYGLMGEQIRRRRLGMAVDTTQPAMIADGIRGWRSRPDAQFFEAETAARFAQENTIEQFAEVIFTHVIP